MNKTIFNTATKLILLCCCFSLLFVSCGSKKEETVKSESTLTDIEVIQESTLSAAKDLPDMSTVNSNSPDAEYSFSYICKTDYSKIEGYFLSYSNTATADEIAVIRLKDQKDTKEALESLQKHLQDRISLFSTYAEEEVNRLNEALVFSEGNYAVLIVCNNPNEVKDAFIKAIK